MVSVCRVWAGEKPQELDPEPAPHPSGKEGAELLRNPMLGVGGGRLGSSALPGKHFRQSDAGKHLLAHPSTSW
jgi:hypothetical protein